MIDGTKRGLEGRVTRIVGRKFTELGYICAEEIENTGRIHTMSDTLPGRLGKSKTRIDLACYHAEKDLLVYVETECDLWLEHPVSFLGFADIVYIAYPYNGLELSSTEKQQVEWAKEKGVGVIQVDMEREKMRILSPASILKMPETQRKETIYKIKEKNERRLKKKERNRSSESSQKTAGMEQETKGSITVQVDKRREAKLQNNEKLLLDKEMSSIDMDEKVIWKQIDADFFRFLQELRPQSLVGNEREGDDEAD